MISSTPKQEKKVMMNHSLAKALMEAGVQHLDGGGVVSAGTGGAGALGGIAGALTTQNSYTANAPTSAQTIGGQQSTLAQQLQNEAAGNGPNPAQIQYQQNAQALAQAQAATNAQNRALNPGLAARLSGNQAVAAGQSAAAGEGAQQAEQQIQAQKQLTELTGQEQTGLGQAEGINSQVSQNNANSVNNTSGGILNGIGGLFGMNKGGNVGDKYSDHLKKMASIYHPKKYASGGMIDTKGGSISIPGMASFSNAGSLPSFGGGGPGDDDPAGANTTMPDGSVAGPANNFGATQLTMPALGSGAGAGGASSAASLAPLLAAFGGGKVPGKPLVNKNAKKNDTVPAILSPGEDVLPLSVTHAKDAPKKAAEFVKHLQENNGKKESSKTGYDQVVQAKKSVKDRLADLEKLCMGGVA